MSPSPDSPRLESTSGPRRVDQWSVRGQTLSIGRLPLLMGILNVTPDSFSDGGRFFDHRAAIEQGLRLAEEGADVIDVGGESTRPHSAPVEAEEELRRVIPVVTALCEQTSVPVSIDTSKAVVAREAVAAGARIINDVTGFSADPRMLDDVTGFSADPKTLDDVTGFSAHPKMLDVAVESAAGVCVMHMLGSPKTMQDKPTYGDVVEEVLEYLRRRRDALVAAGIAQDRIALDPGIGFGKTPDHNLSLLSNAWRLHELGCPVLIGHSRKSFIGVVLGDPKADRTPGTIGVALSLARQGVQILRLHNVAPVRQALQLHEATGGLDRVGYASA